MSETLRKPVPQQEVNEAFERLARVYGVGGKREPVHRVYGNTPHDSRQWTSNDSETPEGGWVPLYPEAVFGGTSWHMAGSEVPVATEETEGAVSLAEDDGTTKDVVKKSEATRAYLETNEAIRDLATVDGVQLAHIPKGSGSRSGQYMNNHQRDELRTHADQIKDSLDERADEIAFLERSKPLIPALDAISNALESIDASDEDKAQAVIRRTLVASNVFGKNTALEVGNLSNDELMRMLEFARSVDTPQQSASVESQDILPVALPPAFAGGIPVESQDILPVALPPAFAGGPIGPESNYGAGDSPELQAKLEQLEAARQKWAKLSTKRQGRLFDRRIHGYNDAKEQYEALVQETGRMRLQDELAAASSQDEKNALAIGYYASEQNKLRALTRHETDGKFVNKFANWMNKGSLKARIAKGVILGVVVGAGGGLALGAAGAASAAGVAVAASRFVRGYTSRNKAGVGQLTDKQIQEAKTSIWLPGSDGYDEMTRYKEHFSTYFELDSKDEQYNRRKALAWGVGSVAVGAAAGYALEVGLEHWQHGSVVSAQESVPASAETVEAAPQETLVPSSEGVAPETPNEVPAVAPVGHDILNYQEAYTVHSGEGWLETLKDMGVPKENWTEVLNDAGPALKEQGWAYFDRNVGEWRIDRAGELSEQAMQTLKDSSAKLGYVFNR